MRLPDDFLEAVRMSNDIVSVMSSYVNTKRTGRDYVCSCPFHSEKTPSCHIYSESQSFYCFGCGAGGDVITFIRLIERLDYLESVKFLAQRAGLSMPEDSYNDSGANKRVRLLEMNREAARYFRDVLLSPEGKEGMDYLIGRQLTPNTIRKYGLGFAPEGWHNLQYYLRQKGYTDDEMEEGALLARNNNSRYDKFRRRVMFPIIDRRGNVIAFGGRTLEKDAPAKYLNSDETLVFQKRDNLFSLNFAKNTKEKCFILCEGYMDVIALNQAGFENVVAISGEHNVGIGNAVATLGTAITPSQANLMKRYVSEAVISYDSDSAGQKATVKAINLLGEAGVLARVLKIPDAKDPDEYIKKFGAESFRQLLSATETALDYEYGKLKSGIDLSVPSGKSEFLKKAIPFLAEIRSDTERTVYTSETARLSGEQSSVIAALVKDKMKYNRYSDRRAEEKKLISGAVKRAPITPDAAAFPAEEKAERGIIAFLFHSPDRLSGVEAKLSDEDFPTEFNRRLYIFIKNRIKSGESLDISAIGGEFSAEEVGRIIGICRQGDMLPYSVGRLEEYIGVLLKHKEAKNSKSAAEMTDEELLQRVEEMKKKRQSKG